MTIAVLLNESLTCTLSQFHATSSYLPDLITLGLDAHHSLSCTVLGPSLLQAQAANQPPVFTLLPPLQPTYYHLELSDPSGTAYCSIPVKINPPEPNFEDSATLGKKDAKGGKAKPPSAKKAPPPKGGKGAPEPPVAEVKLARGTLRVTVPLTADVKSRDWLRNGGCQGNGNSDPAHTCLKYCCTVIL